MEIQEIELSRIVPTPDNPRFFPKHDPALEELAASIKQHGVLEPVLCRPHPEQEGCVDLRAGERRFRAATMAGLKTLPCIVRDMTDDEALVITVTENWQRQDLHPIEEANGIQSLIDKGWTYDQVSAQLGCPVPRIARRARLSKLSTRWKKLVADDKHISEWPVSHLELVARLPESAQDDYLDAEHSFKYNGMFTLSQLRNALANRTQALAAAPWKLDDRELVPSCGSCEACLKRSDRQPELFDDGELGKSLKRGPQGYCLDAACWESKAKAWQKVLLAKAKEKHENLVVAGYGDKQPSPWEFRQIKKTDPGAVPVFDTTEGGKGLFWGEPRTYSSASAKKAAGAERTLHEKRADLERLRRRLVIGMIVETLEAFTSARENASIEAADTAKVLAFIHAFGTNYQNSTAMYSNVKPWEDFDVAKGEENKTLRELFLSAVSVCASRLRNGNQNDTLPAGEEERVCDFFGLKLDEYWERAKAKKKEPKAWAKQEAADKPTAKKKAKAPKAAKAGKDDEPYDEMEVEDETLGTPFEGNARINEHGVFVVYETIEIALPKQATASLYIVPATRGDWRKAAECRLPGASGFGHSALPCINGASYPTRDAAIEAAWQEVRKCFEFDSRSVAAKKVLAALDIWHAELMWSPTGICNVCGCVEERACMQDDGTPCSWANSLQTLCSACVDVRESAA